MYFPFDKERNGQYQDEFYMRGGICWPMTIEVGGVTDVQGFILMAGQDVNSKKVHVFEQKPFVVVQNIIGEDGRIQFSGVVQFLNTCHSRYFARDYFWNQDFNLKKSCHLEIIRHHEIEPKPAFIEIEWSDTSEAMTNIWKYVKTGRLIFDSGSELHEQLQKTKGEDKQTYPAVWALMCLLSGLERYPWRVM